MSQNGDVSDRLRAALERLAQLDEVWTSNADGQAARAVDAAGAQGTFDALLAEVADTVMPAKVILSGAEAHVALAVAGRRVQGLLGASADALGEASGLIDTVLSAEDATAAEQVGAVVKSVLTADGPFALRTEVAPRLGAEAEPGLTPDQLRELWLKEPVELSELEQFLRMVEPTIRGGIISDQGEVKLVVGDASLSEPLVDVLEAAWPDFERDRARIATDHTDPSLTCWQQSGGPVVAVAVWPQKGLAALAFLPDDTGVILSNWNNILATST